jgi:shikimate 5-dehydrogenase
MGFVGVTTASSSIMRVFPRWAEVLRLPTRQLVGHDIPLDAPRKAYRDVTSDIKADPRHWGALVTTHKMAVFEAASDLFDDVDELAEIFGEISSVAKRGNRLTGAAKDPVTVRLALEEFLAADHFSRTGAAALVLGSGGAGSALSYVLSQRADRPSQLICTALSAGPLDHLRALHERAGIGREQVRYVVTSNVADVDGLLRSLPPASLVVNATGMGKDRPGSPVSDGGAFPEGAVVWDFNYRGSLDFLRQARAQAVRRRLVVEDGWRYFIHGWTEVIADVFQCEITSETVARLSRVAAEVR